MRIVFAGTPKFAVKSLSVLNQSEHKVVAVYCQPDRPKGRGKVLTACPVKIFSEENNLLVIQPEDFKDKQSQTQLALLNPDVMVVAAYGQILPKAVLEIPKLGCLNIHASLLPRWRGAAPIERAILEGDRETGISIMKMNEGLDTGDIMLDKKCMISNHETAQTLHDTLSNIGANAILETLNMLPTLKARPQQNNEATYAEKVTKDEAQIDWHQSAEKISRVIRAFNPRPIAYTNAMAKQFKNRVLRIIEAEIVNRQTTNSPGEVIKYDKDVCYIATSNGVINLKKVQLSGKNKVSIKDFNNAYQLIKLN
jgi:methionyl-tRNA formyltransferase